MNLKNIRLSSITLTKNEEARIAKCLAALSFCDECIVVDNDSTDRTVKIAQQLGARVVSSSGLDFAKAHNIGKKAARGEWLLYVDADEIVTIKLAEEILSITKNPELRSQNSKVAYWIKRQNFYLNHAWPYQDQHLRLFQASALEGWRGQLHETPIIEGQTGILKEPLIHDTHRTLEEMVTKTNEWSAIEAQLRFDAHHPPVAPWRIFRVMAIAFWESFFSQSGWRAGVVGWIESIYQSFSMFITYAKLWEMQRDRD